MSKNDLINLDKAFELTKDAPDITFLWHGIPSGPTVNMIAAQPKIGKSTASEVLAYHLLDSNKTEFLGLPIMTVDVVAMISFEEHFLHRTRRQKKQLSAYDGDLQKILGQFFVLDENATAFLNDDNQRENLLKNLFEIKPNCVIIDSLGRIAIGPIEESSFAQKIMLYLRHMAYTLNCPIIILHHTTKGKNKDEGEVGSNYAGSRVVLQEIDCALTIVKSTQRDVKIIKSVAHRYTEDFPDIYFSINQHCLLDLVTGPPQVFSMALVEKPIPRDVLEEFIKEKCTVSISELEEYVSANKIMGRSTMFEELKKLPLIKSDKGIYTHKGCKTALQLDLIENLG